MKKLVILVAVIVFVSSPVVSQESRNASKSITINGYDENHNEYKYDIIYTLGYGVQCSPEYDKNRVSISAKIERAYKKVNGNWKACQSPGVIDISIYTRNTGINFQNIPAMGTPSSNQLRFNNYCSSKNELELLFNSVGIIHQSAYVNKIVRAPSCYDETNITNNEIKIKVDNSTAGGTTKSKREIKRKYESKKMSLDDVTRKSVKDAIGRGDYLRAYNLMEKSGLYSNEQKRDVAAAGVSQAAFQLFSLIPEGEMSYIALNYISGDVDYASLHYGQIYSESIGWNIMGSYAIDSNDVLGSGSAYQFGLGVTFYAPEKWAFLNGMSYTIMWSQVSNMQFPVTRTVRNSSNNQSMEEDIVLTVNGGGIGGNFEYTFLKYINVGLNWVWSYDFNNKKDEFSDSDFSVDYTNFTLQPGGIGVWESVEVDNKDIYSNFNFYVGVRIPF